MPLKYCPGDVTFFCGNSVRGTSIGGKNTVRGYGKICSENVVFGERFLESPLYL